MSSHPPNDVLRLRSGSLEWRRVESDIVVLDLDKSEYLHLNRTGAALWDRLSDGATSAELAQHLVATYGVHQTQADGDVDAFLRALRARRLLEA